MVEILAPTMAAAVVITPDTPRGLPKEILAPLIQAQGVPVSLRIRARKHCKRQENRREKRVSFS